MNKMDNVSVAKIDYDHKDFENMHTAVVNQAAFAFDEVKDAKDFGLHFYKRGGFVCSISAGEACDLLVSKLKDIHFEIVEESADAL